MDITRAVSSVYAPLFWFTEVDQVMSQCKGSVTLSTRVDEGTRQWIEERANAAGVTPTELLRRLLDVYNASVDGRIWCVECGTDVDLTEEVEQ